MKKIAIMQPYFFPYLGYFSLIKHTDEFILFDTAQFIRHGWIERNRILKQQDGWVYIKAPLEKHQRETAIRDLRIDDSSDWRAKIIAQIQHYKKDAPYFHQVKKMIEEALAAPCEDIVSLNRNCLVAVCSYLGIQRTFPVFSTMGLDVSGVDAPDEWALRICQAIDGVEEYWNPPGGMEFFDRAKYESEGIDLKFQIPHITEYDQHRNNFESGLSIIDVLMFNSRDEVNRMLDDYELR